MRGAAEEAGVAAAPRVADAAVARAASGVRVRDGDDTLPATDGARAANQARGILI